MFNKNVLRNSDKNSLKQHFVNEIHRTSFMGYVWMDFPKISWIIFSEYVTKRPGKK